MEVLDIKSSSSFGGWWKNLKFFCNLYLSKDIYYSLGNILISLDNALFCSRGKGIQDKPISYILFLLISISIPDQLLFI